MKSVHCIWNRIFNCLIMIIICLPLLTWSQAQKRNYAVIGLKNAEGVTAGEAEIIADRLRIELFNTGAASMMERDQMQDILSEQGFQQTGACTDEACMVEIGQLLGVERLISGSIGKLGSMFLLNFRAIDVQTAKIIAVVSKDITGGIEDVVKLLPSIARELVAAAGPKKPVETPTEEVKEPEKKEPEVVEEKPEVKEPEEKEPEPEPEIAVDESGRKAKNKNRSGIRLSFSYFPGDMREIYYWDEDDNDYKKHDSWDDEDVYNSYEDLGAYDIKYKKNLFRFQLNFIIKAGEFIAFDIGPGLMLWNNTKGYKFEYYDTLVADYVIEEQLWKLLFVAPNVSAGINFVKRFYPLKINIGFLVDMNFNIIRFSEDLTYNNIMVDDYSHTSTDFKSNLSFGPRVGLEILGGKHFGFNVDFLLRWYTLKTDIDFVSTYDQKWKFKLPVVGLSAGLNFYY